MKRDLTANKKRYKRVLSIAGYDGGGGAGIQADLKTFSALGCYGMTVLTALPVQNTQGVKSIYELPVQCIEEQIHATLEDLGADVVKIGMLYRPEIIEVVVHALKKYLLLTIVVDPVMVSKSGDRLLVEEAITALKELILPLSTVLTPNIPEAENLLNTRITSKSDMENAAKNLLIMGPHAVAVKGGHRKSQFSKDCLCFKNSIRWFKSERINTINTHGTGCTFSAAIAAMLAKGKSIPEAVEQAKEYLFGALKSGADYKIGHGNGPVNHFYNLSSW